MIFFVTSAVSTAGDVSILLEKSQKGVWSVSYSSLVPVKQLSFKRSPDNSRKNRWMSLSDTFRFDYDGNIEKVSRIDGKPFKRVTFQLKATYISLPKEYAPFSPYTDGGVLLHTGRFFACAEICLPEYNEWSIEVQSAKSDNIIVRGRIYTEKAKWLDGDEGIKVYVGRAIPQNESSFVSVIDENLPEELKTQISSQLPLLMNFFSLNMGKLEYRPALFASYSSTDDGTYGHQGGAIPGQMFMHWYGSKAIEEINSDEVFWFFSHEVAHLFQREGANINDLKDQWLHEGGAEFFAGKAMEHFTNDSDIFQQKLEAAHKSCLSALDEGGGYAEISRRNPKLHYSCGMSIFSAIDEGLSKNSGINIYKLWSLYNKRVASGNPAGALTFIAVAKPYLPDGLTSSLYEFSSSSEVDLLRFFSEMSKL
ncbi:hypothetical protein [Microbulbifer sp. GL-2]|uniref:hypothetical protein n=1 Tax=Microbulbifer sp. GL-2 TaxID=2591606 RepID=UPI00117D1D44|nr:hypothetical protein [Microbulbifer sp. GL-2]